MQGPDPLLEDIRIPEGVGERNGVDSVVGDVGQTESDGRCSGGVGAIAGGAIEAHHWRDIARASGGDGYSCYGPGGIDGGGGRGPSPSAALVQNGHLGRHGVIGTAGDQSAGGNTPRAIEEGVGNGLQL